MRISDWSSDVCSSDLADARAPVAARSGRRSAGFRRSVRAQDAPPRQRDAPARCADRGRSAGGVRCGRERARRSVGLARVRSEEHTSELQSLMRISYAVFCLKKKNNTTTNTKYD